DQAAIRTAMADGGIGAVESATSDRLVSLFAIAGTPDEARQEARRYQESIPHVILHPPYAPPLSPDATEEAFRNIVTTFGDYGTRGRRPRESCPIQQLKGRAGSDAVSLLRPPHDGTLRRLSRLALATPLPPASLRVAGPSVRRLLPGLG